MKRIISFFVSIFIIGTFFVQVSYAQLTGIKTIPGDYATIFAAVNDLNTVGVGSGGVTFNIAAGYTETLTSAIIVTATGTSSNPIVFQKSGSGVNPLITSQAGINTPSSAIPDGIWVFAGSDYITVDGIDLFDPNTANPATMEYGYGLFKNSVTDGCQNITIKNCIITLNRINNASGSAPMVDGSVGILVTNSLYNAATTALVPTAPTGSNSNNKFYTNTIQNSNYGIVIYGFADVTPFLLADFGNDIGGSSAGQGNNILNYGGGAASNPAAGIRTLNQQGLNISYNTINNNNGSGVNHATTLRGIYAQSGISANITISYNTITLKSAVTTSQVSVIENGTGATAASNTININNNTITNCTNDLTTTGAWYGIYNNGASASNLFITNNTFTNNTSKATSGATYMIYNNAAVASSINLNNNNLSCNFTNTAAYTGTIYSVYNSSGTLLTNVNMNNNNFSNYNFGSYTNSGTLYFIYNSNSSANLTINGNTWTNLSLYHTAAENLIYNSSSTQVALTVTNNSIVTAYNRTSTAGSMYCYYNNASSLGTSTQTFSGNNFSNITANVNGAGTFYGLYSGDGSSSPYPKKTIFNNTFNNIIYKGTTFYGIYMSYLGDGSTTSGSSIYNNTISNVVDSGVTYSLYPGTTTSPTYAPSVYSNNVNNITSYGISTAVYGYYLGASTPGLNFYKNKAYNIISNGATGIAYGLYTLSSYPYNIYNNFIGDIKAPNSSPTTAPYLAAAGMYLSSGTTVNVLYNTVYLNTTSIGTNFTSAAVYSSTGQTSLNLQNNIFVNLSTPKGLGFTIALQRSGTAWTNYAATSNNNDFYAGTPGATNLICYDGTNSYQTLASYKPIVTPRDAASITENPNFISTLGTDANYLHINTTIASQLESGGTIVSSPSIVDDYDGQARYPNSGYPVNPSYPPVAPDIGADEFAGIPLDLVPPSISYTPVTNTPSTSPRTLVATITDASGVPTSGIGLPVLYWKINSGSYSSVTATSMGGNQYQFIFGSGVVTGDAVSYYVCAQDLYATPNVSSYPSGGASGFSSNPPAVSTPPTTPSVYNITNSPLAGDYTVGLTLFNKVSGKNISFEKVTKKVTKEVAIDEPSKELSNEKGKTPKTDDNSAKDKVTGKTKMVEVDEISWIPMENGKQYYGDLYVKKSENPNLTYPNNINGIYATITAAVTDLNLRGVSAATRFLLNDASYTTETFPIVVNIANENQTSSTKTVTIKPNTGVISALSAAAPSTQIFKVLSNYITIDGSNTIGGTTRDFTIQNMSATAPQVVVFGSTGTTPISGSVLKNCNAINGINSSSAIIVSDGTTPGNAGYFNNITIQNNSVGNAYMGFYCNAVMSSGNGNGLNISGNNLNTAANPVRLVGIYVQGVDGATLSNNNIGNDSNTVDASNITGIWIATGTINTSVSGNYIANYYGTSGGPRGIAVSTSVANANITITGNTITNLKTMSTTPPYGMYIFSTTSGVNVTKNKVSTLLNSNTGGYGARGINVVSSISPSNINLINNFVWDIVCTGDAGNTYWGVGIAIDGTTSASSVLFNSVNLFGSYAGYTSATVSTALYVASTVITLNLRNNILSNTYDNTTSATDKSYAINCQGTSTVFSDINYNDYFVSGVPGVLGYLSADQATLSTWRTATGKDANSVSGNPNFISPSDLHIDPLQASVVSNAGYYIGTVTDDIDGNTRNNPPDIGGDEYTPLTPTLLSPANNSVGNALSLNLIWRKPLGATGFSVLVATDAGFTNIIASDTTLTDSVYTLSNLTPLTYYYWKVRAKFVNWGEYSGAFNFKTYGTPTTVVLNAPANNSVNQPVNLNFYWYKAVDQTDALKKKNNKNIKNGKDGPLTVSNYWFELATDVAFANIVTVDSSLTDTTKAIGGLNNSTDYFWRVKAKNQGGWGTFSAIWKFTTVVPVPGVPVLISPAYNSIGNPLSLNLVWHKPLNSTGFNVLLATDTGFTNILINDSTLTDSIIAVTNLSPLTSYYWKVRAKSVSGWSDFSSPFVFKTIGNATQVVLASPANGVTNQPLSQTFTWFKAGDLTNKAVKKGNGKGNDEINLVGNYWYELSTSPTFATVVVRDSLLTDTLRAVSGLTYNTLYYWRVKAKNEIGWGAFSNAWTFTTALDPTALTQINFTSVIIPRIMSCGGTTRMPVVFRATINNLTPNRLYRFYNGGAIFTDIRTTAFGAGNPMFMNPDSSVFRYTSSASLTTAGGYDVFRANGSGTFTGWFSFVNTANARFAAGKYIIPSIVLGDSVGVTLNRFALNDSIKVTNFSSSASDTCSTGIYGISVGFPRNIISIYDNVSGTGKPLAQTYLEVEGVTVASIAPFYTTNVEGQNGRWGTVIPNVNANGVRRVEQRNLLTGNIMTYNTDADGTWPSGANTVNPTGGLTPVGLLLNDAPLLDYPTLLLPANNATGQPVNLKFDWTAVTYANSYRFQLATDSLFVTIVKDTTLVPDSLYVTGLASGQNYFWKVAGVTTTGTAPFSGSFKFSTVASSLSLNLKVYLEGFWNGTDQIADTVGIYLASSTTPYTLVDSQKVVLGTTGLSNPTFSRVSSGSYYIVIKHRNHLETWSALPQTFVAGTPLSYDFTTAATQAYGSNMKQVGSVWVNYGGDPNIDGDINGLDIPIFVSQFGSTGYISCDFNGDGDVNGLDVIIISVNFGISKVVPTLLTEPPEIRNQKKAIKKQEFFDIYNKQIKKNNNINN